MSLKNTPESFWSKAKEANGCLEWQFGKTQDGYGRLNYRGKKWISSRLAYFLLYGDIPEHLFVCHTCDNPSCIKPEHLFLGTAKQNTEDSVAKKRHSSSRKKEISACPKGHPYTEENTYVRSSGCRSCKTCMAGKNRQIQYVVSDKQRARYNENRVLKHKLSAQQRNS